MKDAKTLKDKKKAEEEAKEEAKEEEAADEEKDEAKKSYEPATVTISLEAERYKGKGTVVLRGAKILTMDPDRPNNGIIDDGAIVITDNRITEVGSSSSIRNPRGATEINVQGKVIIPGFVDTHSHMAEPIGVTFQPGVMWPYVANLAYGVTTTRDPQTSRSTVFDYTDLVEAGELIGPRVFATGHGVFSRHIIDMFEDPENLLQNSPEYHRTNNIHTQ